MPTCEPGGRQPGRGGGQWKTGPQWDLSLAPEDCSTVLSRAQLVLPFNTRQRTMDPQPAPGHLRVAPEEPTLSEDAQREKVKWATHRAASHHRESHQTPSVTTLPPKPVPS